MPLLFHRKAADSMLRFEDSKKGIPDLETSEALSGLEDI
jgi:hypothetical protein